MSDEFKKESAAYYYDEDEEEYVKYYDVGDGRMLNQPQTWYPEIKEDQDLSMTEEFGDPERLHRNLEQEGKQSSLSGKGFAMNKRARQMYSFVDRLDNLANDIEQNHRKYGMSEKDAYNVCLRIDKLAETLEEEAEEAEEEAEEEVMNEEEKDSIVMEQDPDEPYNEHYDIGGTMDNSQDPDEPYMDWYGEEKGNEFDNPYEGETGEELMGHPEREASSGSWYEDSKTSSTNEGGNWYEGDKTSSRDNWYEGDKTSSSDNWYEGDKTSSSDNWYGSKKKTALGGGDVHEQAVEEVARAIEMGGIPDREELLRELSSPDAPDLQGRMPSQDIVEYIEKNFHEVLEDSKMMRG